MLPPPTVMASSTPPSTICAICEAISLMTLGSMPVALLALQRLARKLEQDALVLVVAHMTPFSELGRY